MRPSPHVAYKVNGVIAIYPITPSSPMAEHCDAWSALGKKNLWGVVPNIAEMQSEAGAAAAVHGALQAGSLSTTFTASQGLMLMIPNMYKIAGELSPTCWHVTARSLAAQALSIYGDHQDVMAVRQIGFALLASNSVQEAHDLALVGSAATLKARVPFIHFFDGFRTSHEVQKLDLIGDETIRDMIDDKLVIAHRLRAMSPDRPTIRGTSQNPDVYFQGREAVNQYYLAIPGIVQEYMDQFAAQTGRQYHLFDYVGAPDAERVIVIMGSGAETAHETVEHLVARGEKVGVVKVRLYRPFSIEHFLAALPPTVKRVAVLDRTKEPGARGEPLYLDVVDALSDSEFEAKVIGGRYGLSSKEFTPAMVKAVFDELAKDKRKKHFTVGINDDVTHMSLEYDENFSTEPDTVVRALFYGLGSDGTVGANKNSIKIIGEDTENYAQGYFVYDAKKAGVMTVSHLRFGPEPIRSSYLVNKADFIACHFWAFMERFDLLAAAVPGATFLINAPYPTDEVWDKLPRDMQQRIIDMKLKLYAINAFEVAKETGMGGRTNTIMQTCFFYLSNILPQDEAIAAIKKAIEKTYGKRGEKVVQMNFNAVDKAIAALHAISVPAAATSQITRPPVVPGEAPEFVRTDHRRHHGRPGRGAGRQRDPGRRCLAHRHHPVGEAQHRPRDPRVGARPLHPVRQVLLPLPARHHPHQGLRPGAPGRRAGDLQVGTGQRQGLRGHELDGAGGPRGLHRLRTVHRGLPRQRQERPEPQGHQHGLPAPAARERARQLRVLRDHPLHRQIPGAGERRQGQPASANPCSSTREPAPAAGRLPTSSSSLSSSATVCSSATPRAAPASTGATCPPRPTPRMPTDGVPPGTTPFSRTRPSSATACGSQSTGRRSSPRGW